jgi:hypothetical protein
LDKRKLIGVVALCFALAFVLLGLFSPSVPQINAQTKTEICDNGIDDDGDKAVDCADTDCASSPSCVKTGTGCSPGFYKNHPDIWVGICCGNEGQRTCESLMTALTCKGSDSSCGRSAAAAYLDACTGCSE